MTQPLTPSDLPAGNPPAAPHRPADDTEEVYFEGSPLLRAESGTMLVWGLGGVVLLAVPFVYHHFSSEWPIWWVTLALVALAILVAVMPVFLRRSLRYRITNYRIDVGTGLLAQNTDTLELWHVEDIRLHQSVLDRILNVGNITVYSHVSTTPQLALRGLPDPQNMFKLLEQRIISVKRQRGVVKMDSGT